jgi:hypothetical protein
VKALVAADFEGDNAAVAAGVVADPNNPTGVVSFSALIIGLVVAKEKLFTSAPGDDVAALGMFTAFSVTSILLPTTFDVVDGGAEGFAPWLEAGPSGLFLFASISSSLNVYFRN